MRRRALSRPVRPASVPAPTASPAHAIHLDATPSGRGVRFVRTPHGLEAHVVKSNGDLATPPFRVARGHRLEVVLRAGQILLDVVDPVRARITAALLIAALVALPLPGPADDGADAPARPRRARATLLMPRVGAPALG